MPALAPHVEFHDGRALTVVGDVLIAVYRTRSTVERNNWVWARVERAIARSGSIVAVLVVLPGTLAPESEAREQSVSNLAKHRVSMRRFITVVEGDALWLTVVRTLTRATVLLAGTGSVALVVDSEKSAVEAISAVAGPNTPSRAELAEAFRAARAAVAHLPAG